jgi:hypothetical protein
MKQMNARPNWLQQFQLDQPSEHRLTNFLDLHHLCAVFRAPRADNRMNASAAQAGYIKLAPEWIGFTLMTPLRRVIFDHHNSVHDKVLLPGR